MVAVRTQRSCRRSLLVINTWRRGPRAVTRPRAGARRCRRSGRVRRDGRPHTVTVSDRDQAKSSRAIRNAMLARNERVASGQGSRDYWLYF